MGKKNETYQRKSNSTAVFFFVLPLLIFLNYAKKVGRVFRTQISSLDEMCVRYLFFSLSCSLRLIDSRYRLLFELYHTANEKRNLNIGKAQKPFTISKMKGFFQIIQLITNSSALMALMAIIITNDNNSLGKMPWQNL